MNFKEKYQKEMDSVQFSQDFEKVLTQRTLYASAREDNRIIMKRTNPVSKNNLEFLKDGKIINANVLNLIHKNSLIKHCSFIKPIHRLIGLGKLVI